jgi:Holliday junction resolvase RusA-like endonuclease
MSERRIIVFGEPLPQGSKSARVFAGRAILTEGFGDQPKRRKLWREAVAEAARAWLKDNDAPAPLDGAIALSVTFFLPRPASAPKRVTLPIRKPDSSKLLRAVEDSLTGLLYVDDARIVEHHVRKRFAIDSPPRAEIVVSPFVEDALLKIEASS